MDCPTIRTVSLEKRIPIACLLIIVGLMPLAGCATEQTRGLATTERWKPANERAGVAETRDTTAQLPSPATPGLQPSATAVSKETVRSLPPLPSPPVATQEYAATSMTAQLWDRQTPNPPIRLVSDELPSPASIANASLPNPPLRIARVEPRSPVELGVVHVNQRSFERQVLRSDVTVLVDFYATWCGPCKALAPRLEEVAAESPRARIVKVDIDDSPELAARYGVDSVPTLLVFKDGQLVAKQSGVASKARLKAMLDL